MQPIPQLPNALPLVDLSIIDDRWAYFQQYVIMEVTRAPVPFSCVDGYFHWFKMVSHPMLYMVLTTSDPVLW